VHPVLFGPVKSYGFLLALSFLAAIWLGVRRGRRRGMSSETVLDLVFIILVSSLVGVRLFYVVTHLGDFDSLLEVLVIWDGGLTLYGGIVAAIAATWWACRRRGLAFLGVADVLVPGLALGLGITRIGCFLAGCCYGEPCDLPWAVRFPAGAPATLTFGAVAVHPSQLYASAAGFAIFGALLLWERWPSPRGATFSRFLLLYAIDRFLVDFSRFYPPAQRGLLALSQNQWISLGLFTIGLGLLVFSHRRAHHAA